LCAESDIDLVLIQEPWIYVDLTLRRTRRHAKYMPVLPSGNWTERPRVCTYISTSFAAQHSCHQLLSPVPRDLLPLRVLLPEPLTLWNVYNAPHGSTGAREACSTLTQLPRLPAGSLLAGDFNYPSAPWLDASGTDPGASSFADWAAQELLVPVSPLEEPTHQAGNVLDLVWCHADMEGRCLSTLAPELSAGSDHHPLRTEIATCTRNRATPRPGLALSTLRSEVFTSALQAALNAAPSTDLASATALDAEARLLTDAISKAAHQSAKPKGSTPRALPFWTADCKAMAADLH